MKHTGPVFRVGDSIDTDTIIPGTYTKSLDYEEMKRHTFEPLIEDFYTKVSEGHILVAGDNFGLGSSREQAPLVLKLCGIKAIVAKSFSRIFFRNAINLGIILVECNTDDISQGDTLCIDLDVMTVSDIGGTYCKSFADVPPIMKEIMSCDGMVAYMKTKKELEVTK